MIYLVIHKPKQYAGRWKLEIGATELDTYEWGLIKQFSGYMPLTQREGLVGGDPALQVCYAMIALIRGGRITYEQAPEVFDVLARLPFGDWFDTEEVKEDGEGDGDAVGPPSESSSLSGTTSGEDGTESSGQSVGHLNGTGTHDSDLSVSDPVTSAA